VHHLQTGTRDVVQRAVRGREIQSQELHGHRRLPRRRHGQRLDLHRAATHWDGAGGDFLSVRAAGCGVGGDRPVAGAAPCGNHGAERGTEGTGHRSNRAGDNQMIGGSAMTSRRMVLKGIAGAGAWLAAGGSNARQPAASGTPIKRAIPVSGEQIPVIGLGTYQAFDVTTSRSARAPLKEVLQGLVDNGGSVVDSSPMYGRAEEVVGDLAAELTLRPSLFLATQVWTSGRDGGVVQVEDSFRLLKTRTIDLMQIHSRG